MNEEDFIKTSDKVIEADNFYDLIEDHSLYDIKKADIILVDGERVILKKVKNVK